MQEEQQMKTKMENTETGSAVDESENTPVKADLESADQKGMPAARTQTQTQSDFLLMQIDEFREKAAQLQRLFNIKESKVAELSNIVAEREVEAEHLQNVVKERKEAAENVVNGVRSQLDGKFADLDGRLRAFTDDITKSVQDSTGKTVEVTAMIRDDISRRLNEIRAAMDELGAQMKSTADDTANIIDSRMNEMKTALDALGKQAEDTKAELIEKIHTEDVQCYRNMADLIEGLTHQIEENDTVEYGIRSLRVLAITALSVGAVNLIAAIGLLLHTFGII